MDKRDFFANKVVLLTGASSGIGLALARQLGRAGARLGLMARRETRLEQLRAELSRHTECVVLVGDVASADACEEAVAKLVSHFGHLDVVVANAGVSMNASFDQAELEVFHRMMAVNYFGSLHMARFARPHLGKSRGSLVFISSIVGKRGFPTRSGYAASKFAVHALFESLRVEWADAGIHVGIVAPGYTGTEIREHALGADGAARGERGFTSGDVMSAEDAAAAIVAAIVDRRREVILTRGGKLMVWLNKLLPGVADRVAARVVR